MRTITLLLFLIALGVPAPAASAQDLDTAQGARIESVDVTGLPLDELSAGLRRDIDALTGTPLEDARVKRLADRIEQERPDVVAAVRTLTRPDGQVRVMFLVARISENDDLAANINARYTVESVEIRGIPEIDISAPLRDRVRGLVGGRLDPDEADELRDRLADEKPGYDVSRRISRGTRPGQIHVVFEFAETDRLRWIPFERSRSKFVYHSDQGWSGLFDVPIGDRDHRVTLGFALDDNDTLIEEYSGARIRFQSRRIGTQRIGASLEFSALHNDWRPETLAALALTPSGSAPYETRLTVEPLVTVALTPQVRVTGGLSFSSLDSLARPQTSQMANAIVGGISFRQRWVSDASTTQQADAGYEVRSSVTALDSDLSYTRHLAHAGYRYEHDHHAVIADVFVGGITGQAPLFERFTLGDSVTLRGWNKFEIDPAGGDRVWHQSLEYRYYGVGLFLDTGSIWNRGGEQRLRTSAGFGILTNHFFLIGAFPLDTTRSGAAFTIGVRF